MRALSRSLARPLVFLLVVASEGAATASPSSSTRVDAAPAFTRTDPRIALAFAYRARTGATFPLFTRHPDFEENGRLPVILRFARGHEAGGRARLTRAGVVFPDGGALASGAFRARVTERTMRAVEAEPQVTRIASDLPVLPKRPLALSATETRVDLARRLMRSARGQELDGRGTTILDIDGSAFVFHPSLFRANAGAHRWVDVDKNGRFTVGKDGLDIDESGTVDAGEKLVILRADAAVALDFGGLELAPWRDYLFVDKNANGKWDRGPEYGDEAPGFGEPIYVVDDADGDGVLDLSERLLRLGTHRVRAILGDTREFKRGGPGKTGISHAVSADLDMTHATPVLGILAGGHGSAVSRFGGLAPGAEILLSSRTYEETGSVEWGLKQGANVILTEFAVPGFVSLDGSTEFEAELDAAVDRGVLVVSPAGNLGDAFKHQTLSLKGATTTKIAAELSSFYKPSALSISLHHRGPKRSLRTRLRLPSGVTYDLPEDAPGGVDVPGGDYLSGATSITPRGTWERHYALAPRSTAAPGNYEISLTLDAGSDLEVELYVMDDVSAWGGGFALKENTPSRTLCYPATGDKTIAVGAYTLRGGAKFGADSNEGDLALYSSRGPRIDGDPGIDVIAPANPVAPAAPSELTDPIPHFEPFGGTSGAGPHVAATIALLRQRDTEGTAADVFARLLSATRPVSGASPTDVGRGKLDALAAIGLGAAPQGVRPRIAFRAPLRDDDDVVLGLDVLEGDAATLRVRWDDNYDGTYDTGWETFGVRRVKRPEGSELAVRVEVLGPSGETTGDTLLTAAPSRSPPAGAVGDPLLNLTAGGGGCSCDTATSTRDEGTKGALASTLAWVAVMFSRGRRRRWFGGSSS